MSKGSGRRPEDAAAIERNWPFGRKSPQKHVTPSKKSAASCPLCYKPITTCRRCGREHCPCTVLSDCSGKRRAPYRVGDPLEQSPYGFEVNRSGCRDIAAPPEKDTPPLLNHEFMRQRGKL